MRSIYLSKIPLFQKQIISGVVFGVSIWALVDDQAGFHDLMDLSEADSDLSILTSGPWILIVSSGLVMIVTFLGCYGALKVLLRKLSQFFWENYAKLFFSLLQESKIMLIIYGCVLGAFVFFYMSGAIVISVEDVKKEVAAALLDTLERYEPDSVTDNDQKIVEAWNSVMEEVRIGNPRCVE